MANILLVPVPVMVIFSLKRAKLVPSPCEELTESSALFIGGHVGDFW